MASPRKKVLVVRLMFARPAADQPITMLFLAFWIASVQRPEPPVFRPTDLTAQVEAQARERAKFREQVAVIDARDGL